MARSFEISRQFENLEAGKSLFFASDFHLGASSSESSLDREKRIIRWLDQVREEAAGIFLVGDIFDFWFEYKKVVPKGFIRFQAKLLELRDAGIPILIFTGNHDKWYFDYFPNEFDIPVFYRPTVFEVGDQRLLIGHGDGLGPGDRVYKLLKVIFEGRLPQWLFRWLHPDIGVSLAHLWSRNSRISSSSKDSGFQNRENEWLWHYSREIESRDHHDYYIFGHRHIPMTLEVSENSSYINLGEWVNHFTYARYDGHQAELLTFRA